MKFNLANLPKIKEKKRGKHRIIFYRDDALSKWIGITWTEFSTKVDTIAKALVSIGVGEKDNIGLCSQNFPQGLILDFACYANRAVVVPMFATLSAAQIIHIINDAKIKLLFVGEQLQFDNALEASKSATTLQKIVVFDKGVDIRGCDFAIYFSDLFDMGNQSSDNQKIVDERRKKVSDSDLVNIMYTSGTSGVSKGVMLSYENIAEAMKIHQMRICVEKRKKSIAFLPLSHIFERLWTYYCLYSDVKLYLNAQPADILRTIKEVKPNYMCSVPRFWEKVSIGVKQKIEEMKPFNRAIVAWAVSVGQQYNLETVRLGKHVPLSLWFRYKIANSLVFNKLKKALGIEHSILFPSAGAAMSDKQIMFFRSLGIPVCYGYGLTETSATVCCFEQQNYTIGSVGTLMPGIQVKIGEDNEIMVKGKTVSVGYYNMEKETSESFVDGWFRTGDVGKIEGNTLYMTDRLKDLFKTSNGKYISPQAIETTLTSDAYFEQVAAIGNNRNFVTAIIAPSIPLIKKYAEDNHIEHETIAELIQNPKITDLYRNKIDDLQKDFASFEKIKKFRLISRSFSVESGELTATLKIKRAVITQNYAPIIDEMYDSEPI